MKSNTTARAFVTSLVATAFLWALAVSPSPQLHQRVHNDADRVDHTCAVTLIASGGYNHAPQAPLITAPIQPVHHFSKIPALIPRWVQSPFLGACIFEHAPPFARLARSL